MKKSAKSDPLAERPNLDFSKGVRGKYTNLLAKGTNVAIIDPTLHPYFPDSEAVNRALRAAMDVSASAAAPPPPPLPISIRASASSQDGPRASPRCLPLRLHLALST